MSKITRRLFAASLPVLLGGCVGYTPRRGIPQAGLLRSFSGGVYGEMEDGGYEVPAVDTSAIDPSFLRQEVAYSGHEGQGTIIVDPNSRHLFFVKGGGRATRYGVGVGRQGFGWSGVAAVRRKSEWPGWTPPSQMIRRQPELEEFAEGMPGGLDNPLGARGDVSLSGRPRHALSHPRHQ